MSIILYKYIIEIEISISKEVKMLKIGNPAPLFKLQSTKGNISLTDYKGKYIVLFFYPLDFTPV